MATPAYTVCTVASPQYLPQARAMLASVLDADPGVDAVLLHLGRADDRPAEALRLPAGVEAIGVDEVGIDPREVRRLGLMYSTQGLAGAMKARLIRFLLDRDERPVVFVDADICAYRSMEWIAQRAEASGRAVLTSHVVRPLIEAERPMLSAGVFNSGFMAFPPAARDLVDWWCSRTARDCIFRPNRGLLWEQAWLGLAPAFFDVEVLREPGVNTLARELLDRDVEWDSDDLPVIGGRPLTCYHFSGPYDPNSPQYLLAPAGTSDEVVVRRAGGGFAGLNWLSLERRPGAARLSREYADRLLASGFSEETAEAVFSAFDDGQPIHRTMRRAYRTGLMRAEREGAAEPPNPFSGASLDSFVDWLLAVPDENAETGFSRLIAAAHETYEGAPIIFPRIPGADTEAFVQWTRARLRAESRSLPDALVPTEEGPAPRNGWLRTLGRRRSHAGGNRPAR